MRNCEMGIIEGFLLILPLSDALLQELRVAVPGIGRRLARTTSREIGQHCGWTRSRRRLKQPGALVLLGHHSRMQVTSSSASVAELDGPYQMIKRGVTGVVSPRSRRHG